jgi:hypothetical protein
VLEDGDPVDIDIPFGGGAGEVILPLNGILISAPALITIEAAQRTIKTIGKGMYDRNDLINSYQNRTNLKKCASLSIPGMGYLPRSEKK